jgi:hypothetical protein
MSGILRTSRYDSKSCCDNNIPARGELGMTTSSKIKYGTAATRTTIRSTEIPSRDYYYETEAHKRKGTTNTNTRRTEDRYDTENYRIHGNNNKSGKGIGAPRDRYNNNTEQFGGSNRAPGDCYSKLRQCDNDAWRNSRNDEMPEGDRYELDRYEC